KLRRKLPGGHEKEVAESLQCLAFLYQEKGDLTAAEPLYRECLKLRRKYLGANHPDVADTLNVMGQLYGLLGQDDRAVLLFRQGLKTPEDTPGRRTPDPARGPKAPGWAFPHPPAVRRGGAALSPGFEDLGRAPRCGAPGHRAGLPQPGLGLPAPGQG